MKNVSFLILLVCAACDPAPMEQRCQQARAEERAQGLPASACQGPTLPRLPRG